MERYSCDSDMAAYVRTSTAGSPLGRYQCRDKVSGSYKIRRSVTPAIGPVSRCEPAFTNTDAAILKVLHTSEDILIHLRYAWKMAVVTENQSNPAAQFDQQCGPSRLLLLFVSWSFGRSVVGVYQGKEALWPHLSPESLETASAKGGPSLRPDVLRLGEGSSQAKRQPSTRSKR